MAAVMAFAIAMLLFEFEDPVMMPDGVSDRVEIMAVEAWSEERMWTLCWPPGWRFTSRSRSWIMESPMKK
jgi:hypothetical protein